ncbi:MAG: site-2 protease family protein [Acidobacteria bacterium]|nr:site-2 protease family protein [Acidobacteriota bacterium]
MRSWALPAGRIFGVEIRIHLTFLLLLLLVWLTEATNGNATPGRGLALVAIVFGCVVFHELGHALASYHAGIPTKAIILLPIGGVSLVDETQQPAAASAYNWKRDIVIAMAGPAANLLLAVLAAVGFELVKPGVRLWSAASIQSSDLPRSLVWCSMGLAAMNLLPAYPLDGGRVLRALFSRRSDSFHATRRAVAISQVMATVLMVAGMVQYMQEKNSSGVWLTMVGFLLLLAAQLEERSVVFQSVLETVRMEEIMLTDFATLSPTDTLEDALEKAVHSLQDDFPVIRGSDMVGVVSRQRILHALRAEGNGYVQAVMSKIFEVAQKQESLASAFRKLTSRNLSIIPVVEEQRLVGIVTLQNLMHSMALLAESKKLRRESLDL